MLDTYEAERRPIAEQVIWAASSLHEIFMGHGKDIAERAQKIRDPAFLEAVVGRCSGISYTYRDQAQQPKGAPRAGPAIGDRAPDVDLGRGRTLFDLTRHPSCTLIALPAREGGQAALQASLKGLAHRFAAVLELRVVPPSAGARGTLRRERRGSAAAAAARRLCRIPLQRDRRRTRSRRGCTSGSRFEVLRLDVAARRSQPRGELLS